MAAGVRVLANFLDEGSLLAAVRLARAKGWAVDDVFGPYPVHALDEAMGVRRTRLPWVTLLGGFAGMVAAIALQVGTAVVDWPLNVGGKPANSALAFLPVTFELTVLLAGLSSAVAFVLRARLYPLAPLAAVGHRDPRVTDDTFVLVVDPVGAPVDAARQLLVEAGGRSVRTAEGAL